MSLLTPVQGLSQTATPFGAGKTQGSKVAAANTGLTGPAMEKQAASGLIDVYVVKASLVSTLEMIGNLNSAPVSVDPAIDHELSGIRLSGTMAEVMERLARQQDLIYWCDGIRHYIAPAKGQQRTVLSFNNLDAETVRQLVGSIVPYVSESAVRIDTQARLIHINAPRELRDAIKNVIDNADRPRQTDVNLVKFGIQTR